MKAFDLYPHKCRQCGKRFEGSIEWAYKESKGKKKGFIYFCSWRCLREFDKGRVTRETNKRKVG